MGYGMHITSSYLLESERMDRKQKLKRYWYLTKIEWSWRWWMMYTRIAVRIKLVNMGYAERILSTGKRNIQFVRDEKEKL